jgi:hypothetical protein
MNSSSDDGGGGGLGGLFLRRKSSENSNGGVAPVVGSGNPRPRRRSLVSEIDELQYQQRQDYYNVEFIYIIHYRTTLMMAATIGEIAMTSAKTTIVQQ